MDMNSINWLAVVVAAVSAFALGGLWYSKILFANSWMKETNLSEEKINNSSKARAFGFTFFFSLLMAFNLAIFLNDPKTDAQWGATAGALAGIWGFSAIAITALFELKNWRYIFINGGYILFALTLMGWIIGAWR